MSENFKDFWAVPNLSIVVPDPNKLMPSYKPEDYNTGFTEEHARIFSEMEQRRFEASRMKMSIDRNTFFAMGLAIGYEF